MSSADGRLPTLDLFSGIGGFSYALRKIARTVAYCEIEPKCRDVLKANMRRGRLDKAPIFEDVSKLSSAELAALRPVMVTAGFPCQDVSIAGARAGLNGAKSGLFFEIMRILRQARTVQHVLLENSPNIKNMGLERVLSELRAAGFEHIAYGYFSASDVGALHKRSRWVCLASKSPSGLKLLSPGTLRVSLRHEWKKEPARVVPRPADRFETRALKARWMMLGNAVVPQFITHAYQSLALALSAPGDVPQGASRPDREVWVYAGTALPRMVRGAYQVLADNRVDVHLVDDRGNTLRRMDRWHTPVHGRAAWDQGRTVYKGSRVLQTTANNIYYEKNTDTPMSPDVSHRSMHHIINPQFVEHLMGYPLNWTAVPVV